MVEEEENRQEERAKEGEEEVVEESRGWKGEFRAWRWNDYEERKGTAGGTTGKKEADEESRASW